MNASAKEITVQVRGIQTLNTLGKEKAVMETNTDGTYFQQGDRVRLKRTGEQGIVNAADGGMVYVTMDVTNDIKMFSAYVDEDAYIEIVSSETAVKKL